MDEPEERVVDAETLKIAERLGALATYGPMHLSLPALWYWGAIDCSFWQSLIFSYLQVGLVVFGGVVAITHGLIRAIEKHGEDS